MQPKTLLSSVEERLRIEIESVAKSLNFVKVHFDSLLDLSNDGFALYHFAHHILNYESWLSQSRKNLNEFSSSRELLGDSLENLYDKGSIVRKVDINSLKNKQLLR